VYECVTCNPVTHETIIHVICVTKYDLYDHYDIYGTKSNEADFHRIIINNCMLKLPSLF